MIEQGRRANDQNALSCELCQRAGEELAADALSVTGYQSWGCNDYALEKMDPEDTGDTSTYLVLSPRDVIIVRPRDRKDQYIMVS